MILFTSREMDGMSADAQAKKAISHTLQRIRDDKHIGYLCGIGSQTFALLTEAAATLFGKPVEEVRRNFVCKDAQDPEAPQWISVESEMPDCDIAVLIYVPGSPSEPVWIGYHDGDLWRSVDNVPLTDDVTHWMHLPEAPAQ